MKLVIMFLFCVQVSAWADPGFHVFRINSATKVVLEMNQGESNPKAVGTPGPGEEVLVLPFKDMCGHPACDAEPTKATQDLAQGLRVPTLRIEEEVPGKPHLCCRPEADLLVDIKAAQRKSTLAALVESKKKLNAVTDLLVDLPGDADLTKQKDDLTAEIAALKLKL